ncbi:hypothetical protein ACLOJK_003822 [Asimina triloba]
MLPTQTVRNSYCIGSAGIEAAEATTDLMKATLARKEADEGTVYLSKVSGLNKVTVEDMEAYKMKKIHHDDPMKDFLHRF